MVKKTRKAKKVESRYAVNVSMKAWDSSDWDGLLGTIEIGRGTFAREPGNSSESLGVSSRTNSNGHESANVLAAASR